jgi:hypothetical protein
MFDLKGDTWLSWSTDQQNQYVTGFLFGNYTTVQVLLFSGMVKDSQLSTLHNFNLNGLTSFQVVDEITMFYLRTARLDYPVYIVIFFRNLWKTQNIPPWSTIQSQGLWE